MTAEPVSRHKSRVSRPDVHPEVRAVADALIEALGDNLKALLWHGSFARGEARPDSDHDMIVVLKRIDDGVLLRLRDAFRGRANWSTFVQSEEELRQWPETGRLQFHFGFVKLYGDFEPPPWTRVGVIEDLRKLALDIRFECRLRLLHKGPELAAPDERLTGFQTYRNLLMLRYAAKWAVLALKARELLRDRAYPETMAGLRARIDEADELAIVDLVERWSEKAREYETDITPLALQLDAFARKLVAQLPEEGA